MENKEFNKNSIEDAKYSESKPGIFGIDFSKEEDFFDVEDFFLPSDKNKPIRSTENLGQSLVDALKVNIRNMENAIASGTIATNTVTAEVSDNSTKEFPTLKSGINYYESISRQRELLSADVEINSNKEAPLTDSQKFTKKVSQVKSNKPTWHTAKPAYIQTGSAGMEAAQREDRRKTPLDSDKLYPAVDYNYDESVRQSISKRILNGYVVTKDSIRRWIGGVSYQSVMDTEVQETANALIEVKINESEEVTLNYNELADTLTQNYLRAKYGDFNLVDQKDEYVKLLEENTTLILKHKKEL